MDWLGHIRRQFEPIPMWAEPSIHLCIGGRKIYCQIYCQNGLKKGEKLQKRADSLRDVSVNDGHLTILY